MTGQLRKLRAALSTLRLIVRPKCRGKAFGGGDRDQWNERLANLVIRALPVDQSNAEAVSEAGSAAAAGMVDMKPTDPVEGMLMAQFVAANEAALAMYKRAWACSPDHYFQVQQGTE